MTSACLFQSMAQSVKQLICLSLLVGSVNPHLHQVHVVEACLHKEQVSPYFPSSHWITASKNSATLLQTTVDVKNHSTHYAHLLRIPTCQLRGRSCLRRFFFFFWRVLQRNIPTQKAEISFNPKTKSQVLCFSSTSIGMCENLTLTELIVIFLLFLVSFY